MTLLLDRTSSRGTPPRLRSRPARGIARTLTILTSALAVIASMVGIGFLAGCAALDGLGFVQDERVEILSPRSLSTASVPMTFTWRTSLPADQKYALILGLEMVGPGRPVTDLVSADGECTATGDCRSVEALADADIYLTTGTSVTVAKLPSIPANQTSLEARLVLVDEAGRREGESLWYVTLRVPKVDS